MNYCELVWSISWLIDYSERVYYNSKRKRRRLLAVAVGQPALAALEEGLYGAVIMSRAFPDVFDLAGTASKHAQRMAKVMGIESDSELVNRFSASAAVTISEMSNRSKIAGSGDR